MCKMVSVGTLRGGYAVLGKVSGDICPRCQLQTPTIYYGEDSDPELGARCEVCGFKGFYMNGKLVQVATAKKHTQNSMSDKVY